MASALVLWKDPTGTPRQESARIEDTSHSGACIRTKMPISVGSELQIKWHKEHFWGVTKYWQGRAGISRGRPAQHVRKHCPAIRP